MARQQSVISLDAIDQSRKREKGILGRLFITRWSGGSKIQPMDPFGHYMFCGKQGAGKTASAIWYGEKLARKYKKKGMQVRFYSNLGLGTPIRRSTLFSTINEFKTDDDEVRIIIIDEIQTYYPRDAITKDLKEELNKLTAIFSQLRKRRTYILSTAQVFGRLDKSLREQCLYMINCRKTFTNKLKCEFILGDDIIADDLGRWSGDPKFIYVHGLSKLKYDTRLLITE